MVVDRFIKIPQFDLGCHIMKKKSQTITAILCLFCLHRFYLGKPLSGIVQLFTGGGLIVWWALDAIKINNGTITDSNGLEVE